MFSSPTRKGFSVTPKVNTNKNADKMAAPNNAYYVLTQAHAGLPYSVLISDIDHGVFSGLGDDDHLQYIKVDGTRAFTGEQSMGTNKLINVVDPTADQDAATKKYVDDENLWEIDDSEVQLKSAKRLDMLSQRIVKLLAPISVNDAVNKSYVDGLFPVTHASTTGQTTDDHHNESHDIASHSDGAGYHNANWDTAYGWGDWNGNIDISTDTNLAAGRSLTLSGDSIEADAALYTHIKDIALTYPKTGDSGSIQLKFPNAVTITRISGSTDDGTATIQFDERAEATPNTGGVDVMTAVLVCDSNTQATTSFANAGIAGDAVMNLDIDAAASNPTKLRIHVEFTYDD